MQQEPDDGFRLTVLSMAYHALGQKAESDAALAELIQKYERTYALHIAYGVGLSGRS